MFLAMTSEVLLMSFAVGDRSGLKLPWTVHQVLPRAVLEQPSGEGKREREELLLKSFTPGSSHA